MTTDSPNPLAAAVAAWGLPTAHHLPDAPLDDYEFQVVLFECLHHRLLGLLGASVQAGAFATTTEQRDRLEKQWQGWLAHGVRVERLAASVSASLERAGLRSIVLKGVALAHVAYPQPEWRVYGDVDLLVESEHFTDAANALIHDLDGARAQPELRPGFDDRFGREILVRVDAFEVDLHRTFVDGAFGLTVDLGDLWRAPAPFTIGTQTLFALAPEPRLLHAAYAATLSDWPPRLAAARDLAQIASGGEHPTADVTEMARQWRAEPVLAAAVKLASSTLRLTERTDLVDWADQYDPTHRDRLLLASYRGPARGYTSQAATLIVLPGLRNRGAYLRAIALPQRSYREARGLGRLGLFGAGAKRARRA